MGENVLAANLVVEQIEAEGGLRLRLAIELPLKAPDPVGRFKAHRQSPSSSPSSKARQKSGAFPPPALPGLNGHTPLSDSRPLHRQSRCRSRNLRTDGSPPITRTTVPACRVHIPRRTGTGARVGCFPVPCGLPRISGGSASASSLSRPAQASLTLRPAGLLNRPRRPLSQGFNPAGCPTAPLASYQTNRQLSGWNLPPLVIRAVGAH